MAKSLILCNLALGLILLSVSCLHDSPTAPETHPDLTLRITDLDAYIAAPAGGLVACAFEVSVRDSGGFPAPGVTVALGVESGPGAVACRSRRSDATGVVRALFYAVVPAGDTLSVVRAAVGTDTVKAATRLHGGTGPAEVERPRAPGDTRRRANHHTATNESRGRR